MVRSEIINTVRGPFVHGVAREHFSSGVDNFEPLNLKKQNAGHLKQPEKPELQIVPIVNKQLWLTLQHFYLRLCGAFGISTLPIGPMFRK